MIKKYYMMNEMLFLLQEYEEELKDFLNKNLDYQVIYEKMILIMENYHQFDHDSMEILNIKEYWQEKCKLYYLL